MSLTHFKGISITPDPRGATALNVTGTTAITGNPAITGQLTVSGTTRSSGVFSASASGKQSTLTKLNVTGTTRASGVFSASASGKQSTFTKLDVTGTTIVSGVFTATGALKTTSVNRLSVTGTSVQVASAANAACGIKSISAASGGSGAVATTKALSSSRIFLTPIGQTALLTKGVTACVSTIASGSSFRIRLSRIQTTGTSATSSGRVAWFIVNK